MKRNSHQYIRAFVLFVTPALSVVPAVAFGAMDAAWIEGMIQRAQAGGGTVIIENSSSVSTGGQTAGSGESVTTGNASASSRIETHVQSSNNGGTVKVKIETGENGEVTVEEYVKDIAPGETIEVRNSAQTSSTAPKKSAQPTTASGQGSVRGASSSTTGVSSSTDASRAAILEEVGGMSDELTGVLGENEQTRIEVAVSALKSIPSLFMRFFSFLWIF